MTATVMFLTVRMVAGSQSRGEFRHYFQSAPDGGNDLQIREQGTGPPQAGGGGRRRLASASPGAGFEALVGLRQTERGGEGALIDEPFAYQYKSRR